MKRLKLSLLLTLWLTGVAAQEAILVSGADAAGSGGAISYSVGLVAYTTVEGSSGSLTQGVQQSYEISIVNGIENKEIKIEISAYPNPTVNNLTLMVNDIELSNLTFQLFDVSGNFLQEKRILENQTTVDLNYYASGIYFIKVLRKNLELKNFKIIKK